MTLTQLRTLYWDYLDDPSGGYFTQSVANLRLNLAAKELQKNLVNANKNYYAQCVTASTVADQARYALPSDFLQIIKLAYVLSGSGDTAKTQPLEFRTPNSADWLDCPISGDPIFYGFQKNYIILKPVPTRILTLHLDYSHIIVDMSADGDEPDAPEQFHEFIPVLASRDGFIKDGRPLTPIETKLQQYEKLMTSIANQRQIDRPRMIVATGDGFGY